MLSWTNNGRWGLWSYHGLDGVSHPRAVIPTPGKVNDTPGRKASKPVNVELHWNLKNIGCLKHWRGRNTGPLKCRSAPCRGEALGSSVMLWRSLEAPSSGSSRSSVRWTWTCWCVTSGDYRTTGMCYWKWTGHLSVGWRTETRTRWCATFGSRFELRLSNQVNWENLFLLLLLKVNVAKQQLLPGELWLAAQPCRQFLHLKGHFIQKINVYNLWATQICIHLQTHKIFFHLWNTKGDYLVCLLIYFYVCRMFTLFSIQSIQLSGWGLTGAIAITVQWHAQVAWTELLKIWATLKFPFVNTC